MMFDAHNHYALTLQALLECVLEQGHDAPEEEREALIHDHVRQYCQELSPVLAILPLVEHVAAWYVQVQEHLREQDAHPERAPELAAERRRAEDRLSTAEAALLGSARLLKLFLADRTGQPFELSASIEIPDTILQAWMAEEQREQGSDS